MILEKVMVIVKKSIRTEKKIAFSNCWGQETAIEYPETVFIAFFAHPANFTLTSFKG